MKIPLDCHIHTPLCGHAGGAPEEYVRQAAEKGLRLLCFTCHCPMGDQQGFGGPKIRMTFEQLDDYERMIERARREGEKSGVEVLLGIEAEWFPEEKELVAMDEMLATRPFDYVGGAVHPHLPIYLEWFEQHGINDDRGRIETYLEHLLRAVECGRFDAMTHLDIVRCYGTVQHFEAAPHEALFRKVLDACARLKLPVEINTSGLHKPKVGAIHPDPLILDWAQDFPLMYIPGSDAHNPGQVAGHYDEAAVILNARGINQFVCFRQRQRQLFHPSQTQFAATKEQPGDV